MRYLTGVCIVLAMLVVVLGSLVWCSFVDNSEMWDRLGQCDAARRANALSVTALESALEQKGWALDEAVEDYNRCLRANPDYLPYEFKMEDGRVWWRDSDGEWKLQGWSIRPSFMEPVEGDGFWELELK